MNPVKKLFVRTVPLLIMGLIVPLSLMAQPERFVAGTHYLALDTPIRTANPDRIEVAELFWYGCGHCFAFEPLLQSWQAHQNADVALRRIPATWDPILKLHARAFFTAESMGLLGTLHDPMFAAIHQQHNRLQNEKLIRELFVRNGAVGEEFDRTFNSFAVNTRINQAEKLMKDYGVLQTPTLYVNGKYVVTTKGMTQPGQMLEVVDFLVTKERLLKQAAASE